MKLYVSWHTYSSAVSVSPWPQDKAQQTEVCMTQKQVGKGKAEKQHTQRQTNLQRPFILLKIKNVKAAIICSERREKKEQILIQGLNVTEHSWTWCTL